MRNWKRRTRYLRKVRKYNNRPKTFFQFILASGPRGEVNDHIFETDRFRHITRDFVELSLSHKEERPVIEDGDKS